MEDMSLMRDYGKRVGVKITGKKAADAKAAVMLGILDKANAAKSTKDVEWVKANKDLIDWYNANCEPGPAAEAEAEAKTETPAEKKTAGKKGNGKKDALTEAKAKAEAAKAKAAEEKKNRPASERKTAADKKGKEWAEGSNAQDIFLLIKSAGKKGITLEEGIKAAQKAKVDSSSIESRVKAIFAEAVQRDIARRDGDKFLVA
jgi:colicin import membrane protein